MSDDYYKNELDKIEQQITNLEIDFSNSLKESFDKINKDIQSNDQKNKFKIKVHSEHQLDLISKKFNEIHYLEVKRREIMLKKLKQDQSRTNEKFKNLLKTFREKLFGDERNNLSDNQSINDFLKEVVKIEQEIVLSKNEDSFSIILDDLSLFQLSTKYYQSSNMSKFFIKSITSNYKLIESLGNYNDILEYIDGILNISDKIVENKADILHKYSMKLFKEGKYDESQKKMELAVNTTKDPKGKELLQFELDKVVLTNMHSTTKNFQNGDFEKAIQICDRMLASPYIKDKNKEKIKMIKNLDLKKYEQFKNKQNNKPVQKNLIHEEVNEVDFTLGED